MEPKFASTTSFGLFQSWQGHMFGDAHDRREAAAIPVPRIRHDRESSCRSFFLFQTGGISQVRER